MISTTPTYLTDLPIGSTVTINQDLYIEPEQKSFVWQELVIDESKKRTSLTSCSIDLKDQTDTSRGLLLKAPIKMQLIENFRMSMYVNSNKSSVLSFWCFKGFNDEYRSTISYKVTVNEFVKMLLKINGSLSVAPPPEH